MRLLTLWALALAAVARAAPADPFLVKPYLQMGDHPRTVGAMELLWQTADQDAAWKVEYGGRTASAAWRRVAVSTIEPHRVYRAVLEGLRPGMPFDYRVLREDTVVFSARAQARPNAAQDYRFVVFGDCSADTPAQRAIACQVYQSRPAMVFIPGDIVYSRGRVSEYRRKYYPVYNADTAEPSTGAPLLRSTLFVAAPGNHDILSGDLGRFPDTLAYFYYWSQPLNGPLSNPRGPNVTPLQGDPAGIQAFVDAAADRFPRMANFSFDFGNSHWTVLDANPYADWDDPALRAWLKADLAAAQSATWRFVGFHQPGFNSSKAHFSEQQMRKVADLLEAGKVDLVFTGHMHNYQRSYPMRFHRAGSAGPGSGARTIGGTWVLDRSFDGQTHTRPRGVIYLVTGAGGAGLYNPEQQGRPETWQEFTCRFISSQHSFTRVDVSGGRISLVQLGADGSELDRFVITR